VVEISGTTIRVYSTATKHMQKVIRAETFRPLCPSKWSNHLGFRPLPTQVSVIENTSTLGCEGLSSHKTNHTSALIDVVENSGSTIRVYSTATKNMQKVVQVKDLPSTLHIEVVKPLGFHPLTTQLSVIETRSR
jgi:hypothetical protein